MSEFNINAARMRFFRDMVKAERQQVFRVFGIEEKVLEEVRTHSDERRLFDYLFAARRAVPAQASAPEVYTCVGKGGEYELIGHAMGAGKSKLINDLTVYRDTKTGVLYFRDLADFQERMERVAAPVPAQGEQGARVAALAEAARICDEADKSTHPADLAGAIRAAGCQVAAQGEPAKRIAELEEALNLAIELQNQAQSDAERAEQKLERMREILAE